MNSRLRLWAIPAVGIAGYAFLGVACGTSTATEAGASDAGYAAEAGEGGPGLTGDNVFYPGGSRLRATFLRAANGSRQFLTWTDTQRKEECQFSLAGDGVFRCIPKDTIESYYFSDAGCTQHVALDSPTCAQPTPYALVSETIGGVTRKHVWRTGAKLSSAQYFFVNQADGVCASIPSSSDTAYISLTSEVAPAEFVSGVETKNIGSNPLGAIWMDGADGSREFRGWYDVANDGDCWFSILAVASDTKQRCLPRNTAGTTTDVFSDSTCSSAVAIAAKNSYVPRFGLRFSDHACPLTIDVFQLGPRVSTGLFRKISNQCIESPSDEGVLDGYPEGPTVAPTAFVEQAIPPDAVGRVRATYESFQGGPKQFNHWEDSTLGVRCAFYTMSDGQMRCLPGAPYAPNVAQHFTDSNCTSPLKLAAYPVLFQTCPTPTYGIEWSFTCPRARTPHVYRLGAPISPPALYSKNPVTLQCYASGYDNSNLYSVLEEISPDAFESGTVVVDVPAENK